MEESSGPVFKKTTQQTDCLETETLNFKNMRQMRLGEDLGIYVFDADGITAARVDAVSKGTSRSLAMYENEFSVVAIPWAKIEDRRNPKTGSMSKHLTMDGTIQATHIITSDNSTMDEKFSKFEIDIAQAKQTLAEKIDQIASSLKELSANISLLGREVGLIKEKIQMREQQSGLSVESTDPAETTKWSFKTGHESDGRPSLQVCYDGESASKFVGTPTFLKKVSTPQPKQNQADEPEPTEPQKTNKQKMVVTVRTPSGKQGVKTPLSSEKDTRNSVQVETMSISRTPRPFQE